MEMKEFQKRSTRTLPKGVGNRELINNMVFGMTGELGEVVNILKKNMYQGHELDRDKIIEELGDTMFYIVNLCTIYGIDMGDVLQGNVDKLIERFPDGFDVDKSINRVV